MEISYFINGELENKEVFSSHSTKTKKHSLPIELHVNNLFFQSDDELISKKITITPIRNTVETYLSSLILEQNNTGRNSYGSGSDQIKLSMSHPNINVCEDYLFSLINNFDQDGIQERQMSYSRTINFATDRLSFLQKELEIIEKNKQEFKIENKLTDIQSDASLSINKQYAYNDELFKFQSQSDLVSIIKDELKQGDYSLLPSNFGLDNESINILINQYNELVKERLRYISFGAGNNNSVVKNLETQLDTFYSNVMSSIESYSQTLSMKIKSIEEKESEFENFYSSIPIKEKLLREIERELLVKESLFSLLLQKEEAGINKAVVKPTIKLIDSPRSTISPTSPSKSRIYSIAFLIGFIIPNILLSIWFYFDNKIHRKDDLDDLDLAVVSEIPYIKDDAQKIGLINTFSRSNLAESIRMLAANLKFTFLNKNESGTTILVSSSIKGEGKTLISSNLASLLSSTKKVLLLGADLRNPQIHKLLSKDKNIKGLSDIIYNNDIDNFEKYILTNEKLDIIISGTIPPNPGELLSSAFFHDFLEKLKNIYDYVIIDSAPCLLVSDTFEISKLADLTLYVIRANFSEKTLLNFIRESKDQGKLKNINIVLNSVGNSSKYGYKYGYQYGYKYGYQYGYNYGYGYGYSEDK